MRHTIFWGTAGVLCVYTQYVHMPDIQSAISAINSDPRIDEARFVIHDFRSAAGIEEGVGAMLALGGHLYGRTPYNLEAKTAVLVSGDDEIARFNSLISSSRRPLRAFGNLTVAETWLGYTWQQNA